MYEFRGFLTRLVLLVAATFAFGLQGAAEAAKPEIYTGRFSNLAVDGFDPVAYFTQSAPVKGAREFEYEYKGAVWRFANAENLETFKANPTAYAPQYGGYCAWAIAQGYTARGNPNNWTIYEGKLYLNYNDKVQAQWLEDVPGFIAKGDANWPDVLD